MMWHITEFNVVGSNLAATGFSMSNRLFWTILIPLAITVIGVLAKYLQSQEKGFFRGDSYVGGELTLAAATSSLLYLADPKITDDYDAALFLVLVLVSLFGLMSLHKGFMPARTATTVDRWKDILVLGLVGNAIGVLLLGASVWLLTP